MGIGGRHVMQHFKSMYFSNTPLQPKDNNEIMLTCKYYSHYTMARTEIVRVTVPNPKVTRKIPYPPTSRKKIRRYMGLGTIASSCYQSQLRWMGSNYIRVADRTGGYWGCNLQHPSCPFSISLHVPAHLLNS